MCKDIMKYYYMKFYRGQWDCIPTAISNPISPTGFSKTDAIKSVQATTYIYK